MAIRVFNRELNRGSFFICSKASGVYVCSRCSLTDRIFSRFIDYQLTNQLVQELGLGFDPFRKYPLRQTNRGRSQRTDQSRKSDRR